MQKKQEIKVIRVPIPTPTLFPHTTTNCYLIGNDQDCILVDAGYDQEETRTLLEKVISEHGLATPKKIILTHSHPDHAPGVRRLVDWSPLVHCHFDEKEGTLAAISPWQDVSFLNDGDLIKVADEEIMVIHGPGQPNTKVVVVGGGKNGLPLILGQQ